MKFFLAGQWQDRDDRINVTNPANGEIIDTVPVASAEDVAAALQAAVRGAETMEATSGYERFLILRRAADLMTQRRDTLAQGDPVGLLLQSAVATRVDHEVRQVARMRSVRVLETVLVAQRVVMPPGAREGRRRARADAMEVDPVQSGR